MGSEETLSASRLNLRLGAAVSATGALSLMSIPIEGI
jgi:hypothetical protein